jgi:EAL domain-containing protein (putative c-di-GMP-specific phosphodiesterase class I)/ActR/RegA family two-component response regulator
MIRYPVDCVSAVMPAVAGTVLVVDDEQGLATALVRVLKQAGITASGVTSADAALATIAAGGIDVVVTDISMPGKDGLALLREIRRIDLDMPVLLMTGAPDLGSAISAVKLGALEYITKPFETAVFVESVRNARNLGRLARAKREVMTLVGGATAEDSDRAGLEVRFDRAMDGLWMAYQPIIRADGTLYGYEALLRTGDPTSNPGTILDAAARLDRLPALAAAVRRRVVADLRDADPSWHVFVNFHPLDLLDPDAIGVEGPPFADVCQTVVVEITERTTLDAIADIASRIDQLRSYGYHIAIDDLGSGYAGLSSFLQLRPDVAKFDMNLSRGIDADPVRRKLVASMTQMCHELGVVVVAEGVETKAEFDTLRELGCDLLQGYHIARPGPPFPRL